MFCKYCGAQIDNDSAFCTSCGAGVGGTASAPVQPAQPAAPSYNPAGPSPTKVMVFGIIGLALSSCGLPGLILSAIALRLAGDYMRLNGGLYGQAKVGRILGKVGYIVGIVMTVIWALYIIILILAFTRGMSCYAPSFRYYYY